VPSARFAADDGMGHLRACGVEGIGMEGAGQGEPATAASGAVWASAA
jgi:hypothetical protein